MTMISRQRGFIVPAAVMALGAIVLAVIVGANVVYTKQLSNTFAADREAYLDEVRSALEAWYLRNVSIEATPDYSLSSEQLFIEAGVRQRYGAQMIMSPQLDDGVVRYRKIAIVIPDVPTDGSVPASFGAYSPAGAFTTTPGFVVREFSGSEIQHKAFGESTRTLQSIAALLEMRVNAKMQIDATRESTTNFFLPKLDCFRVADDEFPCTNGWTELEPFLAGSKVLGELTGVPTKNAWGGDVLVNNDMTENPVEAPFTISLQTKTPWNSNINVKAVQPIF